MAEPIRGFQINTILDRFALDILGILGDCLTTAPLDRDRLQLAMLMTLSRRIYVENLLYRDFRLDRDSQWYSIATGAERTARIHQQAVVYLERVLARRPRLARRLRHEPGNMHLLLHALCRFGPPDGGWDQVEIRRDADLAEEVEADSVFTTVATVLGGLRERLGESYSEESRRRRSEYGPIWLIRGEARAEVPEELSLFEVTDATPVPLSLGFTDDAHVQRMLARVLDALNERYMLLRACGLDPDEWHDRDEPSIARLRDMKRLRKPAEEMLRLGVEDDPSQAYRRAFVDLLGGSKQFAGCATFEAFAATEHGRAMLRLADVSLDESVGADDDDWDRYESIPAEDADVETEVLRREEAGAWIEALIADRPELFGPVMAAFFHEVLGKGRPIHGGAGPRPDRAHALLADPAFLALLEDDPAFAGLEPATCATRLYERAEAIIADGLKGHAYPEG